MSRRLAVAVPALLIACLSGPASAITMEDDFATLDESRWRPCNLLGPRSLPGLRVTADGGVLRIRGRTATEGANLGGVRSLAAFRATPEHPFTVRVTRAFHGGRAERGEHGVALYRTPGEFVYVREPISSLFKDWNHYQAWQVFVGGEGLTDIADEADFLAQHPLPLFDCRIHRIPRQIEIRHDGTTVTVMLDDQERFSREIPWNDGFVVALLAGGLAAGIETDAGFADLTIDGEVMAEVPASPIDANSWEPAAPDYRQGDPALDTEASDRLRNSPPSVQAAMVLRSQWQPSVVKQFIDWSVEQGLNCVALDIPWREVEREKGAYDFSRYDGLVNHAVNRGLWVQLKPWWIRRNYPDWISPALEQVPLFGQRELQELTFANDELNDHIAGFVGATVEHYRGYPVTCYTPVGATAAELEYSHGDWRDASDWATAQFREWLAGRYGDVEALNSAWKTELASFGEAPIPGELPVESGKPELRQSVLDWFCYREWAIKQLVDRLAAAIHGADPDAVFAIQMGRLQDGPSCPRRATVGVFYWGQAAELLIADPQPRDGDVMGYIADLIRAGGKTPGMELDAPARFVLPLTEYTRNTVELWRHGGRWGSWANWVPAELSQPGVLDMTKATVAALPKPYGIESPTTAMYVSKWDLYCYHGQDRWRQYRDEYSALTNSGETVIDVLTDDIVLADPQVLDRYERIAVPYADCMDQRVLSLLEAHRAKLDVRDEDAFATHLLTVNCEPVG